MSIIVHMSGSFAAKQNNIVDTEHVFYFLTAYNSICFLLKPGFKVSC